VFERKLCLGFFPTFSLVPAPWTHSPKGERKVSPKAPLKEKVEVLSVVSITLRTTVRAFRRACKLNVIGRMWNSTACTIGKRFIRALNPDDTNNASFLIIGVIWIQVRILFPNSTCLHPCVSFSELYTCSNNTFLHSLHSWNRQ